MIVLILHKLRSGLLKLAALAALCLGLKWGFHYLLRKSRPLGRLSQVVKRIARLAVD